MLALVKGLFVLRLRTDQIVTGTAINILAAGLAPFITKLVFDSTGSTPSLNLDERFTSAPVFVALAAMALVTYIFYFTRAGVIWRFSGESPPAVQAAGLSVTKVRWLALGATGILAGLGGGSLSLFLASSYSPNMTAGRGFIALAALIIGKWRPGPTFLACWLFGITEALQIRLQGVSENIPVQWIQILPYVVTIIALAGFLRCHPLNLPRN